MPHNISEYAQSRQDRLGAFVPTHWIGEFQCVGEEGGGNRAVKPESRSHVLWGENGKLRGKKNRLSANRASSDARDQAISFDTPGGLIRQGVADVFQHYLCFAAKIGRRKNGFGAPEKKKLSGSSVPHLRGRDNTIGMYKTYTYKNNTSTRTSPCFTFTHCNTLLLHERMTAC